MTRRVDIRPSHGRVDDWVDDVVGELSLQVESSSQAFCVAVVSSLPFAGQVLHPAQAQIAVCLGERCFQMISIQNSDRAPAKRDFQRQCPRLLPMEERLLSISEDGKYFPAFISSNLEDEENASSLIRRLGKIAWFDQ